MSDHDDGPRTIGEPAADVTDLLAFTSPENRVRTVLGACVFPSAGEDAIFSNVIDQAIVAGRVSIAGVGNAARIQPADDEIRFSFRFDRVDFAHDRSREPEAPVRRRDVTYDQWRSMRAELARRVAS